MLLSRRTCECEWHALCSEQGIIADFGDLDARVKLSIQ